MDCMGSDWHNRRFHGRKTDFKNPESHTCAMRKHMWRSAWWIPVSYIVRHRQHQYRSTVAGGVGSGVCAVPVGAHHRLAKAQLR